MGCEGSGDGFGILKMGPEYIPIRLQLLFEGRTGVVWFLIKFIIHSLRMMELYMEKVISLGIQVPSQKALGPSEPT